MVKHSILVGFLFFQLQEAPAQSLPVFSSDRRTDKAYMDSLSQLAKQRYQTLTARPRTARTDTLRFKTLHYLGDLYRRWPGRRDSSLHFGNELSRQARLSGNRFYEVIGKLLTEEYYRGIDYNTPQALKINVELLARLPETNQYNNLRYHIYRNLGDLYGASEEYATALRYLTSAQSLLNHVPAANLPLNLSLRIDVEQRIGAIYNQQNLFTESEKHYKAAEALLSQSRSQTEHGYVYDDLAELYLKNERYEQALYYAKKAEQIWEKIRPQGESNSWGTLAGVYTGLGQDELAFQYAHKVLQIRKPSRFVREQAYMALYTLYERRQDWKNMALYYKKYIAMRDSIATGQRSLELISIQKQTEFDRLFLHSQQAQQLQAQRLLTMQKQAEVDRLRASARTEALARQARLSEQQRLLDNERAQTTLNRQQTTQRLQQQSFERQALEDKNRAQQNWIMFISSLSVLVLGVLTLLLYLVQLRKRKAEADLRLAEERKSTDVRIIQNQEEERQRIAADLHDDLGGTLATLSRRLNDIRQHIHEPETIQAFNAIQPLIKKSSDDLRRIAHNLMPPEFGRIGLRNALEQLVHSQPSQPTYFTFITSGQECKLPLEVELNAYRIVSEAIQNIGKHAQARRAAVQLIYYDDYVTITVEDDGLGSRAAPSTYEQMGIGLKNSNLRAEYIGANLWRDVNEAGTLIVLDIPYSAPIYAARSAHSHSPD
ncbi:tetratricopeptide repeat-containing sensor histidine kinase [Spirosoma fluminis]